jgi:hypothetical protein
VNKGICDIYIRRRHLEALLVGFFDLLHVPYAQRCTAKLGPNINPSIIFWTLAIRLALYAFYKWAAEVDLPGMRDSELNNGAYFRMKRRDRSRISAGC